MFPSLLPLFAHFTKGNKDRFAEILPESLRSFNDIVQITSVVLFQAKNPYCHFFETHQMASRYIYHYQG
jgi:hypothetical protein